MQTCQVSRNFRESPEMGRDLQVSRNCKENSRNLGNLIAKCSVRKKCEFLSYLSKLCVSTHEYHLMLGKNVISQLEMTEKSCYCYYPPPRWIASALGDHGNIMLLPPPPTESRRLLEITEKTQEIQQPQLGSSVDAWNILRPSDKSTPGHGLNLQPIIIYSLHVYHPQKVKYPCIRVLLCRTTASSIDFPRLNTGKINAAEGRWPNQTSVLLTVGESHRSCTWLYNAKPWSRV